jgi:arylsulfatase A-like enzyme
MVMFFVDGLDHQVFDEMLARNELPSIDKYLVRRGVSVENAVTCIPSITYAAASTFLTALYPGHHGIVGNNWFDRRSLTIRTYTTCETYRSVNNDFSAPTIYDVLSDRFTVNFQDAVRRGVGRTIDNWAETGICWFFKWHLAMDRWVAADFEKLEGLSRQAGRWPAFVQAYFPGVDARGHEVGADSPRYRQAVANVDRQIGLTCEGLIQAGLFDRTYLLFVTDHGHTPCARQNYIEITPWLARTHGWRIREEPCQADSFEQRQRCFAKVDAVGLNGGNRQYKLYLPGPQGWSSLPTFERCKEVLTGGGNPRPLNKGGAGGMALEQPSLGTLPAVFVGACRKGPGQVWIYGREGDATVTRCHHDTEPEYRYDVGSGDPLGYLTDAELAGFVRAGWHNARAWLNATAGARCPGTVAQIVEFFDSPRAPDIEVFAIEGWDFSYQNVGGHGSIVRRDMWIPMVFAGPGIPAGGRIATACAADVAPTIVELLAGPERLREMGHIDGISLVPQLRAAPSVAERSGSPQRNETAWRTMRTTGFADCTN